MVLEESLPCENKPNRANKITTYTEIKTKVENPNVAESLTIRMTDEGVVAFAHFSALLEPTYHPLMQTPPVAHTFYISKRTCSL